MWVWTGPKVPVVFLSQDPPPKQVASCVSNFAWLPGSKKRFFFSWFPLSCFERFPLERMGKLLSLVQRLWLRWGSSSLPWPSEQCRAMHNPALLCRTSPTGTFGCTHSSFLGACQQRPPSLTRLGGPHTVAGLAQDLPSVTAKSVSYLGGKLHKVRLVLPCALILPISSVSSNKALKHKRQSGLAVYQSR